MAVSHTPGPWTANYSRLNGTVIGWHITAAPHGSTDAIATADVRGELRGPEEEEANARLLVLAPDMLDVIETIALGIERGYTPADLLDENSPIMDRIRAVVRRVKTGAAT